MIYQLKKAVGYYKAHGVRDEFKAMDYTQAELFSSATPSKKVYGFIDNTHLVDIKNQYRENSCGPHGTSSSTEVKLSKILGVKCTIDAVTVWNGMLSSKMATEENGTRLSYPLDFMRKNWTPFKTEDGRSGKVMVDFYYTVDKNFDAINKEIHEGGAVITGYSSFRGLDVAKARLNPYIISNTKERRQDGHLMGRAGTVRLPNGKRGTKEINSWGNRWGDDGCCYTEEEDLGNTFTVYGFTIKYKMDDKKNKTLFETKESRRKRILAWKRKNKGKTVKERKAIK